MSDYLSHDEVEDAMPLSRREQFEWFQTNYNRMAPEDRYWKTLEVYSGDIFGFPKKYLIALKSIKPNDYLKDLPNELTDVDPITVYRGTDALESAGTVRSGISWTINKMWQYGFRKDSAPPEEYLPLPSKRRKSSGS